jgi:hypothetical protein
MEVFLLYFSCELFKVFLESLVVAHVSTLILGDFLRFVLELMILFHEFSDLFFALIESSLEALDLRICHHLGRARFIVSTALELFNDLFHGLDVLDHLIILGLKVSHELFKMCSVLVSRVM